MTRLARAVFLALVAATFGAFFVAQRLKASPAVVDVRHIMKFFSPNGDGRRDVERISFTIRSPDDVSVWIVNATGDPVRRLVDGVPTRAYVPFRVAWDGRTDSGTLAPDGRYRLRIGLRREGRTATYHKPIVLKTTPPRPRVSLVARADRVIGPEARPVQVRVRDAGTRSTPHFRVWRTDLDRARVVREFDAPPHGDHATWDGRLAGGALAGPGIYLIEARVRDRAGNEGSSAPGLPGRPSAVYGRAGVTIRTLDAVPPGATPFGPVRQGQPFTVLVDARRRPYTWRIRRLGYPRPRARGRGSGPLLHLTAPRGPTAVYLLELHSHRWSTALPLAVQGDARGRILVVLPTLSWIGQDRVDDDGDGIPDTLDGGGAQARVPLRQRVFRGLGGLPPEFSRDIAPFVELLQRAHVSYDLTTDLALMRAGGLHAQDRAGVLLPAPLRWVPRRLARQLRAYVDAGGRLASFGAGTLRRGVDTDHDVLTRPTVATPTDPFGARLDQVRRTSRPAGMDTFAGPNALGLLTGSDGHIDGFSEFEESFPPGDSRALIVSVGVPVPQDVIARADAQGQVPPSPRPSLAATRVGQGIVIRVGLPEWPRRIFRDRKVQQITRDILDVLRRVTPKLRSPL